MTRLETVLRIAKPHAEGSSGEANKEPASIVPLARIKNVLLGFGVVLALSNAAQAYDLRIGNGTTSVTIESSTDSAVDSPRSVSRSQEISASKRQAPQTPRSAFASQRTPGG